MLLVHVSALVVIVAAELVRRSGSSAAWARLVSELHVLVLIPALYAELPLLMEGMPGTVVYNDSTVQSWELAVFGFQPSWELAGQIPVRWLSELAHLAYFLYYAIIFVPPLVLYAALTRDRALAAGAAPGGAHMDRSERAYDRALLALALSMLSCYVVFVLWPVQGPRYLAAPEGIPGGPIRALVLSILQNGSSRGAAFPSSHVAVAVTQSLVALRFRRRLGVAISITSALLAFGAVYGGFHYAIDALVGAAVGAAAWWLSGPLMGAFRQRKPGFAPAPEPV